MQSLNSTTFIFNSELKKFLLNVRKKKLGEITMEKVAALRKETVPGITAGGRAGDFVIIIIGDKSFLMLF